MLFLCNLPITVTGRKWHLCECVTLLGSVVWIYDQFACVIFVCSLNVSEDTYECLELMNYELMKISYELMKIYLICLSLDLNMFLTEGDMWRWIQQVWSQFLTEVSIFTIQLLNETNHLWVWSELWCWFWIANNQSLYYICTKCVFFKISWALFDYYLHGSNLLICCRDVWKPRRLSDVDIDHLSLWCNCCCHILCPLPTFTSLQLLNNVCEFIIPGLVFART